MSSDARKSAEKLIATNPTAHSNYFIDSVMEAGIVLTGTEAKSMRSQSPNIKDAWVEVTTRGKSAAHGLEAWLVGCHIAPYSHGNIWNHETARRRKLLLHRHQIHQLHGAVTQKGLTIVPMRMYFKQGRAKLEIGLGKGKKKYDKRQDLKKKSAKREMEQALKER